MSKDKVIVWFRQDLRLADNPALRAALKAGVVFPVYILDDVNAAHAKIGAASRVWLHASLNALNKALEGKLSVFAGDPKIILPTLIKEENITAIFWNRCYEPWQIKRDKAIKASLGVLGVAVSSCNASLLWEPWEVLKADGSPYKVFTPYYKNGCLRLIAPRKPFSKPNNVVCAGTFKSALTIDQLKLLPDKAWACRMMDGHRVGEKAAKNKLAIFIQSKLSQYKIGRDFPSIPAVSGLSPHLHFGEISPNQVWHAALEKIGDENRSHFLSEIAWREFSYYLLYHFPALPTNNFQKKFDRFPWKKNKKFLRAWQKGETGVPIIDAGMRELWQTGVMHNRVRMLTASFLIKNLLIDWRDGEAWFWDCLIDADLASNSAAWQWVAGSGADAAPYFRIFNPVTQSKKFDPLGEYILKFVPELKSLPVKFLFAPWEAPADVLSAAGIELGKTYPKPLVDLKISRQKALDAYQLIKVSG